MSLPPPAVESKVLKKLCGEAVLSRQALFCVHVLDLICAVNLVSGN